jgi:hypothetical protein
MSRAGHRFDHPLLARRVALTTATLACALSASLVLGALGDRRRSVGEGDGAAPAAARPSSVFPAATTQFPAAGWVRPTQAPNGSVWPATSGYLPGYRIGRRSGTGRVTIDATEHRSDVLLRIYAVGPGGEVGVRTAFIASGSHFTLENLAAGTYQVRYRDLDSGALTRSQLFEVADGGAMPAETAIKLHQARGVGYRPIASSPEAFAEPIDTDLIDD